MWTRVKREYHLKVFEKGELWDCLTSETQYLVSMGPIKLSWGTRVGWIQGQLSCFLPFRLPRGSHVSCSRYRAIASEVGFKLNVALLKVMHIPIDDFLGELDAVHLSVLQAGNTILWLEQVYNIYWTNFDLVVSKALWKSNIDVMLVWTTKAILTQLPHHLQSK